MVDLPAPLRPVSQTQQPADADGALCDEAVIEKETYQGAATTTRRCFAWPRLA